MPDTDVKYEKHEPFFEPKREGGKRPPKFVNKDVQDHLVLVVKYSEGKYYVVLSDSFGNYQQVLTVQEKQPFRTRESALSAMLSDNELKDLPRFHTKNEFPPDPRNDALINLELVGLYGISSPYVDKKGLLEGVKRRYFTHRTIHDTHIEYKLRSK